jgi:hypothetical protein
LPHGHGCHVHIPCRISSAFGHEPADPESEENCVSSDFRDPAEAESASVQRVSNFRPWPERYQSEPPPPEPSEEEPEPKSLPEDHEELSDEDQEVSVSVEDVDSTSWEMKYSSEKEKPHEPQVKVCRPSPEEV